MSMQQGLQEQSISHLELKTLQFTGFVYMLKAVLFDLDNTLIFYDELKFAAMFFPGVAVHFADLIPEGKFAERLMAATLTAHKNDGSVTNRELFVSEFIRGTNLIPAEVWQRFQQYYDGDFDNVKQLVHAPGNARQVLESIHDRNLKVVIATNPILPFNAQLKRLSWAGLDGFPFDLVTHIENMSFCKPQLGYYRQVCDLIGEKPENCLMVGDDPANDMVVAKIGMKTFQTVDSLKHSEKPLEFSKQVIGNDTDGIPPADFEGPLACVTEAVESLLY
ncbi:MAG: HAD family hydrolase [Dehalococcoidia bacterium]|nr:MAG: HAD family hydrolase [Dehalococcoidia bacterium]